MQVDALGDAAELPGAAGRWLAALVGCVALATAGFVWLESNAARKEQQASTEAARLAVDLFVTIAASQARHGLEATTARRASAARTVADTWQLFAGTSTFRRIARPGTRSRAAAAFELERLASKLRLDGDNTAGLDPRTLAALSADPTSGLRSQVAAQNQAVERANKYGAKQQVATFAIGLVALSGALLGSVGITRRPQIARASLITGGAVLVLAVLTGGSTLAI